MEFRVDAAAVEMGGHPFAPIVFNRPARAASSPLKVVAFNARSGRHLPEIAEQLRRPPLAGADLILISEADWRLRRSGGREVAAELAADLGMSFAFVKEFGIQRGDAEIQSFLGNAILSSRPLSEVRVIKLPNYFLRRRVRRLSGGPAGLSVRIVVNGRAITAGVAHLNSRWDPAGREFQMRQYLAEFPPDGPAIIGGDFNTTTVDLRGSKAIRIALLKLITQPQRLWRPQLWEPLFARLADAGFDVNGANEPGKPTFTFTRAIPPFMRPKLDWIALRGLEPVAGSAAVVPARMSIFGRRISDHDFIVCAVKV